LLAIFFSTDRVSYRIVYRVQVTDRKSSLHGRRSAYSYRVRLSFDCCRGL